jgi:2-dehydropantoate 2-reductase
MSRVCIFGAGAIGGFLGAKLALAGTDVSLVARGAHLAAIRDHGLTLIEGDKQQTVRVDASDTTDQLGPQDFVIVTLKAHSLPAVIDRLQPLLTPDTAVAFAVNGVPWWYFYGLAGPYEDRRVECVDPGGRIWEGIGPARALACVVYPAAEVTEPGVVKHLGGDRFSLGEPSGERTDRVLTLSWLLSGAGLKAPVRPRIRDEMWVKLWGNCSLNPISVLTGATVEQMCRDPRARALIRTIMLEAQSVGEALGVRFSIDVDKRLAGAEAVGTHRTSMLQDLDQGRSMEIDALVTAVHELGVLSDVATPNLDAVLALVILKARLAGCYPA